MGHVFNGVSKKDFKTYNTPQPQLICGSNVSKVSLLHITLSIMVQISIENFSRLKEKGRLFYGNPCIIIPLAVKAGHSSLQLFKH